MDVHTLTKFRYCARRRSSTEDADRNMHVKTHGTHSLHITFVQSVRSPGVPTEAVQPHATRPDRKGSYKEISHPHYAYERAGMHPYRAYTSVNDGGSSSEDEQETRCGFFTRPTGRSSRGRQYLNPANSYFRLLIDHRYYLIPRPDRYDRPIKCISLLRTLNVYRLLCAVQNYSSRIRR